MQPNAEGRPGAAQIQQFFTLGLVRVPCVHAMRHHPLGSGKLRKAMLMRSCRRCWKRAKRPLLSSSAQEFFSPGKCVTKSSTWCRADQLGGGHFEERPQRLCGAPQFVCPRFCGSIIGSCWQCEAPLLCANDSVSCHGQRELRQRLEACNVALRRLLQRWPKIPSLGGLPLLWHTTS